MSETTTTTPRANFRGTILLGGKTATGIEVPAQVVATLGSSKRPPVRVTIAGYTYRSTVASMRGKYMLPVSAQVRESAGVGAGDELDIELVLDTAPREVTVPRDFAEALDSEPEVRRAFDALSYSNRLRWVLSIEGAKTVETRERRMVKAVSALRDGRK